MEVKIDILAPFFEDPERKFGIRELSRILAINHTTVRKYLNYYLKENYLSFEEDRVYSLYSLKESKKTINLKIYYNLEKLRKSGLVESLEKEFDYPVIVLFGSYAFGVDSLNSDLDLCIISNINKEFFVKDFESKIKRLISIHKFSKNSFDKLKNSNPNLVNSICNGFVLSGQLEVL